jgi:hypothetical protein
MAAPHVAGAAALLRQLYPGWSNATIKSALMSTAKYLDIYNFDETPAQPLDMGAGRLDVAAAVDPGVILDPPGLSFGPIFTGTAATISVTVRSMASVPETYAVTTLYTGDGFTQTTSLPGFSVIPNSITLNPGESAVLAVSSTQPAAGATATIKASLLCRATTATRRIFLRGHAFRMPSHWPTCWSSTTTPASWTQ